MAEFLVVYDYGTGGIWGYATAPSADVIKRLLPDLEVVEERPAWMDDETERRARQFSSFVAGDEATYPDWVRHLINRG
jgi:hypothetical protein